MHATRRNFNLTSRSCATLQNLLLTSLKDTLEKLPLPAQGQSRVFMSISILLTWMCSSENQCKGSATLNTSNIDYHDDAINHRCSTSCLFVLSFTFGSSKLHTIRLYGQRERQTSCERLPPLFRMFPGSCSPCTGFLCSSALNCVERVGSLQEPISSSYHRTLCDTNLEPQVNRLNGRPVLLPLRPNLRRKDVADGSRTKSLYSLHYIQNLFQLERPCETWRYNSHCTSQSLEESSLTYIQHNIYINNTTSKPAQPNTTHGTWSSTVTPPLQRSPTKPHTLTTTL